jgi:plastocyanin
MRLHLPAILSGLWLLAALGPGATGAYAVDNAVSIDNFTFSAPTLTVPVGTEVVWTNRDDIPHTVTSVDDPRLFRSPALDTDDHFAFTFTRAGTYRYFCSIHPTMQGTVIVR